MSREVPLTAGEKLKLAGAIIFALAIMFPLLRFGAKELYRVIVRDTNGYEKAMDECAEYYNFKVVVYRSGLNSYNLEVNASDWRAYDYEQKVAYCDKCQTSIYKIQQKYKMQEEDNQPSVNFYVNAVIKGRADKDDITIY